MKKTLLTLLTSCLFVGAFAQSPVTPATGATTPETSTADAPKWYAMMSSHITDETRKNRWMYFDGSTLATEQFTADGIGESADPKQFAWRLESNGDGTMSLINYTGEEVFVPANATAEDQSGNKNTPLQMVASGEGTRWQLQESAMTGAGSPCAENQWVLRYTGYTADNAFLNAMDEGSGDYGLTIYRAGAHQASGWFFVPLEIEEEGSGDVVWEWTEYYSNILTAKTEDGIDDENLVYSSSIGIYTGSVLENYYYSYAANWSQGNDYIYIKVNIAEEGKYRFSWRSRLAAGSKNARTDVTLYHQSGSFSTSGGEAVSSATSLNVSEALPGTLLQSNEMDLQPGDHWFGVRTSKSWFTYDDSYIYFGDFKLEKYSQIERTTATVSWQDAEGGTLSVTQDGAPVTSGAELEIGSQVTVTATPDEGYVLSGLTANGEDIFGNVADNQVTVEVPNDGLVLVPAYTWVGIVPGEGWELVTSKSLSSDQYFDLSGMSDVRYKESWIEVMGGGGVLEGQPYSIYSRGTDNKAWFYTSVTISELATYKFTYRARTLGTGTVGVTLVYQPSQGFDGENGIEASDSYLLTNSTVLPGQLLESEEIILKPGTYYFGFKGNDDTNPMKANNTYFGDFNLYKSEVPVTTYAIAWQTPTGGTITVTSDGEELKSGDAVIANSDVTITATPDEGYALESLTVNGTDFTSGDTYTVTGRTMIAATFVSIAPATYTVSWEGSNCDIEVRTADGTITNGAEVEAGTEVTITATAHDGYTLESLTVNGADFTSGSTYTVNSDVTIVATVSGTGIATTETSSVRYDAAAQSLLLDGHQAVRVYDVTGRMVIDTVADSACDLSGLRSGIYIAVVDGKTLKFRK